MRDYGELVKALQLCPNTCRGCPRLNTSEPFTECKAKLNRDAADAIEELLAELTTIRKQLPRWISVEERLPEINHPVLICAFGRSVGEGTYRGHDGVHRVWKMDAVAGTYWDDEVTHWMPLPTSPGGAE